MSFFHTVKSHIPHTWLLPYHYALARIAAWYYQNPSKDLVVIGVTGTNGKSTTVQYIAQILTELGETVGYTSTAGFSIAGRKIENRMKMTMPGRFVLQAMLRNMVQEKCTYAVIETSSQGLEQYRHIGIHYDTVVFTNLTPEHIEAHGSFEAYKRAKGLLFAHLTAYPKKVVRGKHIARQSVLNADDAHAEYYASFPADHHMYFSWQNQRKGGVYAQEFAQDHHGAMVTVNGISVRWNIAARFSRLNALAAVAAVHACGFDLERVLHASTSLHDAAGRFERIEQGQPFTVIVDFAYEPYALKALFASLPPHTGRIIGVHGSAGGGRDIARRPIIGAVAAQHEDIVVVTNEDPYDEDPQSIIDAVAAGARAEGKKDGEQLFTILDRAEAIRFALTQARAGDVVLITGKGSDVVMAVAGGALAPSDDRKIVRDVLLSLEYDA